MTDKSPAEPGGPPSWFDLLLTVWVVIVGVIYFGGYFVPAVGALTQNMAAVYAFMVLASVLVLTLRYLHRDATGPKSEDKDKRTKNRK